MTRSDRDRLDALSKNWALGSDLRDQIIWPLTLIFEHLDKLERDRRIWRAVASLRSEALSAADQRKALN